MSAERLFRARSPRPFALHMMLAMGALMTSKAVLPTWSADWPNSKGRAGTDLAGPLGDLAASLARLDPGIAGRALDAAILGAAADYATGIDAYRRHPYARPVDVAPVVWSRGGSTLLDHGEPRISGKAQAGIPALFVPSLINRGWILDLAPGQGMLSWLAGHGVHPFRMEWGEPGPQERQFDVAGYVADRLEPALAAVTQMVGRPPVLVGYCMGGLLALAAAVRRPWAIRGLALLATPWNFHTEDAGRSTSIAALYRTLRPALELLEEVPVDVLQGFFAAQDPIVALRKFRRFAALDIASAEALKFVALEDWLNDGVALTLPVADNALVGWYGENAPGRGAWQVGGRLIDPGVVTTSTLIVIPGDDRIVPPASAAALADRMTRAERLHLPLGHIGMIVGRQAEAALWSPLARWIGQTT
jgi:polyhydroxyalkanoate synthase